MTPDVSPLQSILSFVRQFITFCTINVSNLIRVITGNPIVLIFVICIPLLGLSIGLFRRMINSN